LVEEAVAGEEIILAKAGRPMVRLTPFQPATGRRKLGILKGRVKEDSRCWRPDPSLEKEFSEGSVLPKVRAAKSKSSRK
jgi:antitoxin (DNA-binding transcriptional repressor) of toxin-antitoxin stability system